MITKRIEVRDHATFIPCLAVQVDGTHWLEHRAGFGPTHRCILFMRLVGGECHYDPFEWGDSRTMGQAHKELFLNWDRYSDGDLIDVRVVLKETETPCESEEPESSDLDYGDILTQFKVKPL